MRRRIPLSLAVALVFTSSARRATATDCSGAASPCVNADSFWPHAGPADFESVGSADTVAHRQLGFALVADYLSRPIVLKLPAGTGTSTDYAVNDQVNGTFLWSYGVTDRLQLDFALPVTFGQSGVGLAPLRGSGLRDTAIRDLRFGFAYAFVPQPRSTRPEGGGRSGWGLAGRLEIAAPTGDRDQLAGDRTGVFVPSIAADFHAGPVFGAAEVGARIRPPTDLLGARVGTQIVTSAGVGVDLAPRRLLSAAIEAWALETLVGQEDAFVQGNTVTTRSNSRVLVPSEWQLSVRTAPLASGDLSIQLGGGGPIPWSGDGALTTPRFRILLGIRWEPLGRRPALTAVPGPSAEPVSRARQPLVPVPSPAEGAP
jgi:hypothetical protein